MTHKRSLAAKLITLNVNDCLILPLVTTKEDQSKIDRFGVVARNVHILTSRALRRKDDSFHNVKFKTQLVDVIDAEHNHEVMIKITRIK